MGKFIDLTGQKFGRLTAKERGPNIGKATTWICECDCDEHNIVTVRYSALVTGTTRSCGCLAREQSALNGKKCAKTNPVNLDGEYGIGWTLNTNREFYFDLEDYDKIKNFCWYERVDKTGYHILRTNMWVNGKRQTVTMHQWLGFANHDHHNRNSFELVF